MHILKSKFIPTLLYLRNAPVYGFGAEFAFCIVTCITRRVVYTCSIVENLSDCYDDVDVANRDDINCFIVYY